MGGMTDIRLALAGVVLAATSTSAQRSPLLPPGTTRIVEIVREGPRIALCAELAEDPIQQGSRLITPTAVWVSDGDEPKKLDAGPAACYPTWSPDGQQLALTALDGLWIFTGDLKEGMRRVNATPPEDLGKAPATEFDYRAFSHPRWSPDAALIAVLVGNGGTSWVQVFEASTGNSVYSSPPETYSFNWGADSRSLTVGQTTVTVILPGR